MNTGQGQDGAPLGRAVAGDRFQVRGERPELPRVFAAEGLSRRTLRRWQRKFSLSGEAAHV